MNQRNQSLAGKHLVIMELLKRGYDVFNNVLTYSNNADLVVRIGNSFVPISIRTCFFERPNGNRTYSIEDVSPLCKYIFCTNEKGDIFIVPREFVKATGIHIYDHPGSQNKYLRFKNNWKIFTKERVRCDTWKTR